jgi:hypothetical protein
VTRGSEDQEVGIRVSGDQEVPGRGSLASLGLGSVGLVSGFQGDCLGLERVCLSLGRGPTGFGWVCIGFYERFLGVYGEKNRPKWGSFGDF